METNLGEGREGGVNSTKGFTTNEERSRINGVTPDLEESL
jgi:hypothetical protein